MTAGPAVLHFGIVRAAGQDIAIASSDLVEAVDMPQRLLPLPEPSPLMAGTFLLRGRLVPVLDLQRLMVPAGAPTPAPGDGAEAGPAAPVAAAAASRKRQVAVVAHGGRRLGIGVDTISGVLRVPPSAVTPLGGAEGSLFGHWVVTQEPESRALPVLQVPALLERTPGVLPAVDPPAGAPAASPAQAAAATRRHTLASLQGQVLAFDFADVPDILPMPPMRAFFAAGGPLRGLVSWRGCDVPVVDLQRLLGMDGGAPDGAPAPLPGTSKPLLMVLQRGDRRIGVQTDAVLGMETAAPDATVPLGPGASLNPGCYAGAMRTSAHGIAAVLRVDGLLDHPVVAAFLNSRPAAAAGAQAGPDVARGGAGARTTFLVYRAGGDCATPLSEVEEILDYATPAMRLDAAGGGMCGLVERRGRPLEVFSLRTLLGSAAAEPTAQSRVLVVRQGERLRGFLVDSLVSLVAADATAEIGHEAPALAGATRRGGSGLGRMLTVGKGADALTCRKVGLRALVAQSFHDGP
ncbi:chemotaxis protein CheW [Paracidovorax avenae]|uniref:chemotaxis protein CheW n=1 Tax=Paracidovorax avenae TaxID=80867 RepID=UPI000D1697CC|nr:chemotaxis protein CheW [Paracidovorax avenae]AVS98497.1 chemotaxis protein CheW [Paracidovorax avenae]AVT07518.1 chemotaxis protein CheW [Paracidovorax avenae]AVT21928.1 chemotaxis protein CheW [Paracidovorax avenae]